MHIAHCTQYAARRKGKGAVHTLPPWSRYPSKRTHDEPLSADSTHFSIHFTPCAPASTLGYQKSPYSAVSAPCKEVAFLGGQVVIAGFPP